MILSLIKAHKIINTKKHYNYKLYKVKENFVLNIDKFLIMSLLVFYSSLGYIFIFSRAFLDSGRTTVFLQYRLTT